MSCLLWSNSQMCRRLCLGGCHCYCCLRMRASGNLCRCAAPHLHERRHHIQRHEVTEGVSLHSVQAAVSLCAAAALCMELAAAQHGSLKGGPLGPQPLFPPVCDMECICLQTHAAAVEADSSEDEEGEITDEPALNAEAEEGDVRDVRGMRAAASDDEEDLDEDAEQDDGGCLGGSETQDESTKLDNTLAAEWLEQGLLAMVIFETSYRHSRDQ